MHAEAGGPPPRSTGRSAMTAAQLSCPGQCHSALCLETTCSWSSGARRVPLWAIPHLAQSVSSMGSVMLLCQNGAGAATCPLPFLSHGLWAQVLMIPQSPGKLISQANETYPQIISDRQEFKLFLKMSKGRNLPAAPGHHCAL